MVKVLQLGSFKVVEDDQGENDLREERRGNWQDARAGNELSDLAGNYRGYRIKAFPTLPTVVGWSVPVTSH
jgi:hypothetical protein